MSDFTPRPMGRPSLEQLRKQAKDLLRQYRAGEERAKERFLIANPRPSGTSRPRPVSLADAQFVLAREHGFDSWASFARHVEGAGVRAERYRQLAADLVLAWNSADPEALERLKNLFPGQVSVERLKMHLPLRIGTTPSVLSADEAMLFVAKMYGFDGWASFEASLQGTTHRPRPSAHGLSSSSPFYKIDWGAGSLDVFPPFSDQDWEEAFAVMEENGLTELRARGQMTDAALKRLSRLDGLKSLNLDGSARLTDAGLRRLADMPQLRQLDLTGCNVSDAGLAVLRELPELRQFTMVHHRGISDKGIAHLAHCDQIERVNLLGASVGDGLIQALADKAKLRDLKSGDFVTDAGLALLHRIPAFRTWQDEEPRITLMGFDAGPNYLLVRGQITDRGLASLAGLDGLFALNLDDSRLLLSANGVRELARLPRLGWLGFDATDETMGAIGDLPGLRMLMCQDTRSTDKGFTDLSRSKTLEYIWGRRCYGLTGRGFAALSRLPALRGLSVSCKNVDDAGLSLLPEFPALDELMPMDVQDEGFRHVGRCSRLEAVWCMYCRDTGDAATEHLARLTRLRQYYAGQTHITDRSLEVLSGMPSLERLTFSACAGVTDAGIGMLGKLPRLRELRLELMAGVSRKAIDLLPAQVQVSYES